MRMKIALLACRLALIAAALSVLARDSRPADPPNVADLRIAHKAGLPFVAEWNVGGFTPPWHVEQVRAGHRFVPSIIYPFYDYAGADASVNSTKYIGYTIDVHAADWTYLRSVGAPICLRHNNFADGLTGPHNRLPLVPDSIPRSPLKWTIRGTPPALNDEKAVDNLGDPSLWAKEGQLLGNSLYAAALQQQLPDPAFVWFVENHEGAIDKELFQYLNPLKRPGPWQAWYPFEWKPADELKAKSLRMHDRAKLLGFDSDPWAEYPEWHKRNTAQYRAAMTAFRDSLSPEWSANFFTGAYALYPPGPLPPHIAPLVSRNPEADPFDSFGPSTYIGKYLIPKDFTDPKMRAAAMSNIAAWEDHRDRNPRGFRDVFLWIDGGGTIAGAAAGRHEVITPARWQAYCEWTLWMSRAAEGGVAVCLHHWLDSASRPTDKFYLDPNEQPRGNETARHTADRLARVAKAKAQRASLASLNYSSISEATEEEYILPLMRAVDRVCENETIREFWLRGKTTSQFLPCPANSPTKTVVWALSIDLDGQTLIPAWTPCNIQSTTVNVGDKEWPLEFGGNPSGYWLIETPAPVVPPPTIRKLEH